jgi:WD40 repeat protein
VFRLAFSPDGSRLASAGGESGDVDSPADVTLWDLRHGKEVLTLRGHRHAVYGLAFSRDGRFFASVGKDGTARIWNRLSVGSEGWSDSDAAGTAQTQPSTRPNFPLR